MGGYRSQLAVLVKPNEILGRAIARRWGGTVRRVPVPDFVSGLSGLARIDYADAFVVATGAYPDRDAEQWARAILENDADVTQLRAAWTALGLRVDDDGGIAGWRFQRREPDTVVLGAASRVGMPGELLVALRADELVFATVLSHRTPATRPVWAAVRPAHVAKVTALLSRAAAAGDGAGLRRG